MSKVVSFIVLAGLVLAAVAVVSAYDVGAHQETKFIPISVLAKNQANYGVDESLGTIPVISTDILEDKFLDLQQRSSVPIITYTSLPTKNPGIVNEDNGDTQTIDNNEVNADSSSVNSSADPNDPSVNNDTNNNKDKDKDKNKDKNKDKEKIKDTGETKNEEKAKDK